MLWNLQRWVIKEHSYCHIQLPHTPQPLSPYIRYVQQQEAEETPHKVKVDPFLLSQGASLRSSVPTTQVGNAVLVPWQVLQWAKLPKGCSVCQLEGKKPQNGYRPMSCLWGWRPQNEVFRSMVATPDPCPYHGEKSIWALLLKTFTYIYIYFSSCLPLKGCFKIRLSGKPGFQQFSLPPSLLLTLFHVSFQLYQTESNSRWQSCRLESWKLCFLSWMLTILCT